MNNKKKKCKYTRDIHTEKGNILPFLVSKFVTYNTLDYDIRNGGLELFCCCLIYLFFYVCIVI